MKRASDLLQTTRLDRELDVAEISKKTKIPSHYLIAFENETVNQFPEEPYCSLMVKEYASFLGLNGDEVLCLFRRDHHRQTNIPRRTPFSFSITPHTTFSFLIIGAVLIFGSYLIYEYIQFQQPPALKVDWPETITQRVLEIKGTTDPESTVKINDNLVLVSQDGVFQKKIEVSSPSTVIIQSTSPSGKTTVAEKKY